MKATRTRTSTGSLELLADLQGADGSGQPFVGNVETLLLIATSHFEVVEQGYGKLLARVRTLNRSHQTNVALGHAASMGSHLRFGFEATYGRDTVNMRNDNVADYPWLCFALATVMREYVRVRDEGVEGPDRERVVETMLNGLTPDPRAFIGQPPSSLSACDVERSEFTDSFDSVQARSARRVRSPSASGRRVFADVLFLQFLPQRAQGHGD